MGQLTHVWYSQPQYKVECNGNTFIGDEVINISVMRPENAMSSVALMIDDHKSKNYVDKFDHFDALSVSFRYKDHTDTWTKVFSGVIENLGPQLSQRGEFLGVVAYGEGRAIANTHYNADYGKESDNSGLDTPKEILDDMVDNHINKSFGGSATGYAITKTKIASITTPIINFLPGPYKPNVDLLNIVCKIKTASAGTGPHWFVDPDKNLFVNTLGAHENNATGWPTYWRGSQADSTIEVTKDIILYDFQKNIRNFSNKVIYAGQLRKPAYDYWTEDSGGAALWGKVGANTAVTDDTARVKVGSHSIKLSCTGIQNDPEIYYPSGANAGWDLTRIGSVREPPFLRFYLNQQNAIIQRLSLFTTRDTDFFYFDLDPTLGVPYSRSDEWLALAFPIGPYYRNFDSGGSAFTWGEVGSPSWSNINGINFEVPGAFGVQDLMWYDDMHFTGKIVREAYNSTNISSNKEVQYVIVDDTAHDDSMKASDDSGTCAMLAKAELLRRIEIPTVAIIRIPGSPDILPGQLIHVHAAKKSDGTFRVNEDFRVTQPEHNFTATGFLTSLNLTNDLTNSHAWGAPTQAGVLAQYLGTAAQLESRNLKVSGVDPLVPRLSKDYA